MQSQAKSESLHANTAPIHIYGPEGIRTYVDTMLTCSDTFIGVPVVVYELIAGPVTEAERAAVCLNKRSRLHVVRARSPAHELAQTRGWSSCRAMWAKCGSSGLSCGSGLPDAPHRHICVRRENARALRATHAECCAGARARGPVQSSGVHGCGHQR